MNTQLKNIRVNVYCVLSFKYPKEIYYVDYEDSVNKKIYEKIYGRIKLELFNQVDDLVISLIDIKTKNFKGYNVFNFNQTKNKYIKEVI